MKTIKHLMELLINETQCDADIEKVLKDIKVENMYFRDDVVMFATSKVLERSGVFVGISFRMNQPEMTMFRFYGPWGSNTPPYLMDLDVIRAGDELQNRLNEILNPSSDEYSSE
jgi:hypothetical protein